MFDEWRYVTRTRTADFDTRRLLKPSGVLNLFQDAACAHADALGVGFEKMWEQNLLWVLLAVRYEVVQMPEERQTVTVITWPSRTAGPLYGREYEIVDEDGNLLIRGDSSWALIRADSRKTALVRHVYGENAVFPERKALSDRPPHLPALAKDSTAETVCRYTELDSYGHVNNAAYPDYLWNALKPEQSPRTFLIEYHKELREGDALALAVDRQCGAVLAEGRICGERAFSVKMTW